MYQLIITADRNDCSKMLHNKTFIIYTELFSQNIILLKYFDGF